MIQICFVLIEESDSWVPIDLVWCTTTYLGK